MNILSDEYVRGLVGGEGSFTFDTRSKKSKIPTFVIAMHKRDAELLRLVRETLGISVKMDSHSIYPYKVKRMDGIREEKMVKLIIRDYDSLKNIIVPFFYKKLYGHKGIQFQKWLDDIGSHDVSPTFRHIYHLYKRGYYDKLNSTVIYN